MNFVEAVAKYKAEPTKENARQLAEELTSQLTLREKLRMLRGHAMGTTIKGVLLYGRVYNRDPYRAGGVKRLGIPEVAFADGPRGIVLGHSTCFPVSMLRGATFDDDLEYRVGEVFAKEAIAGGANYFAGICINLLRNPMWGRAQETYGEDPYLLGRMGVALTRAVQDYGMMACPKHYALNSIEDLRFSVSANVTDRTLREVYLPHFKKCVDAGALSIMGAYNKMNGVYCCENEVLLKKILRDEWGFDGFAISDFVFGIYDAGRSINAGLDVEMPYTYRYLKLRSYNRKGIVATSVIDDSVTNVISALIRSVPNIKPQGREVILSKEHKALAREVAEKGIVLLKNDGVLPLNKGEKLAVVGRYANLVNTGDHGSSNVRSPGVITPFAGIAEEFGRENVVLYNGCDAAMALKAIGDCKTVVVCVGSDHKQEGEFLVNLGDIKKKPQNVGGDRATMKLPPEDVALIRGLVGEGRRIIVNIMGGSGYIIGEWKDEAAAVLTSFYGGIEGGAALARVLSGAVNPSGKLPFTMAKQEEDYPSIARIGDTCKDVDYGYYHGYTLFDKLTKEVDYPFGFGLSYTDFVFSNLSAVVKDGVVEVAVTVKNTGARDGAAVAQIYVGSKGAAEDRPVKLLKGFKRTELAVGEEKQIIVPVCVEDLKFYSEATAEWTLDGEYTVYAGGDSASATALKTDIKF